MRVPVSPTANPRAARTRQLGWAARVMVEKVTLMQGGIWGHRLLCSLLWMKLYLPVIGNDVYEYSTNSPQYSTTHATQNELWITCIPSGLLVPRAQCTCTLCCTTLAVGLRDWGPLRSHFVGTLGAICDDQHPSLHTANIPRLHEYAHTGWSAQDSTPRA